MAKSPKRAAPGSGAATIEAVKALLAAHGAKLETDLPEGPLAAGETFEVCLSAPQSIERFMTDAHALAGIRDIKVLVTHVSLVLEVPAEVVK
jgi:hypothetical protein